MFRIHLTGPLISYYLRNPTCLFLLLTVVVSCGCQTHTKVLGVPWTALDGLRVTEPIYMGLKSGKSTGNREKDILNSLNCQGTFSTVRWIDKSDTANYGTSAISEKNGNYSLITDYVLFFNDCITSRTVPDLANMAVPEEAARTNDPPNSPISPQILSANDTNAASGKPNEVSPETAHSTTLEQSKSTNIVAAGTDLITKETTTNSPSNYRDTAPTNATYSAVGFRVGVGLRVRADFITFKPGIEITGLKELGQAAKKHLIAGTLSVESLGIRGSPISSALFPPCEINVENIQVALRSMETVKKLLDGSLSGISLEPQLISINCDTLSMPEAIWQILGGGRSSGPAPPMPNGPP
jgi:hypothetical protein